MMFLISLIFCAVVGLFKNPDCGQIRSSVYCKSRFHREGKNFFDCRFLVMIYLPAPFMNLLVFFVVNKECLFLMQHFCIFP